MLLFQSMGKVPCDTCVHGNELLVIPGPRIQRLTQFYPGFSLALVTNPSANHSLDSKPDLLGVRSSRHGVSVQWPWLIP